MKPFFDVSNLPFFKLNVICSADKLPSPEISISGTTVFIALILVSLKSNIISKSLFPFELITFPLILETMVELIFSKNHFLAMAL